MIQKFGDGSWTSENEAILNHKFPLHRACRDGEAEVLKRLLSLLQNNVSNAEVLNSEEDYYYWSAVHFAAYFGKLDCLRLLVQAATVFNSSRASLGLQALPCPLSIVSSHGSQTPLMVAAFANYPECIEWIMQSNPGNLDFQDNVGETALHKACRSGALSCVQLLVAGRANTRLRNNNGQTASELAVRCGHTDLGEQLAQLTKGAEDGNGVAASPVPTASSTVPSSTPAVTHLVSSNGYYGYQHTHQSGHVNSHQQNGGDASKQNDVTSLAPTTMDTSDSEMQDHTVTFSPNLLTNQGFAENLVPVAGKKRGREDEACKSAGKRGRFQVPAEGQQQQKRTVNLFSAARSPLQNISNRHLQQDNQHRRRSDRPVHAWLPRLGSDVRSTWDTDPATGDTSFCRAPSSAAGESLQGRVRVDSCNVKVGAQTPDNATPMLLGFTGAVSTHGLQLTGSAAALLEDMDDVGTELLFSTHGSVVHIECRPCDFV